MPVHDWTRGSDGTFHDFHYSWVLEIKGPRDPHGIHFAARDRG